MQIICLNKRWKHHSASGGYDRLADALGATDVRSQDIRSLPGRVTAKVWEQTLGKNSPVWSYSFNDRLAEERAFWLAWRQKADIVHSAYGDEQLNMLLSRAKRLPGQLTATFHVPAFATRDRFERTQKDLLKRLGGAVVVASSEVPQFSEWLGEEKVLFVPHGIDIHAFTPPAQHKPAETMRLLFVGYHMRDFEVAHYVADRCAQEKLDVILDVVLPEAKFSFFTACTNVARHSNINEGELIELYRRADALFLPLIHATANNSILEALACGTPVIATDVGGIKDYVDDGAGWLLPPSDKEAAFECVLQLARNRDALTAKRAGARRKAEEFSWETVSSTLLSAYERLIKTGRFAPP
ncbi:glycosyltransferase family 4 protein [Uliginosibacterium sp. H3]|uniref:Glycosyltransferase family 4 protein n=1 Tax=Uliginosibacterium silvisoli TaxID=3114758 RepID=A0ABU6K6I9_9RHOO|nr:glycosyltransferase family 4 protein [Uliginosibacterium sp. H3]